MLLGAQEVTSLFIVPGSLAWPALGVPGDMCWQMSERLNQEAV